MFSYKNLYNYYLKCRRGKRNTINALKFELNAEENLLRLEEELESRAYKPSRLIYFIIEKPKPREIFASDFRDRVVHHILINRLEPIWEPKFIYDSYACRQGKGTHRAVARLQAFTRKISLNGEKPAFFMKLDIKSFFVSIDRKILYNLIKKEIKDENILWLIKVIIFYECTKNFVFKGNEKLKKLIPYQKSLFQNEGSGKGLPIGNLTSQFFANIYLNQIDQFIKHNLKCRYYIRYVDDFVLLDRNKNQLVKWKTAIDNFLKKELNIVLNPKKQSISLITNGINFLGYIIRPNYILVRKRVVNNFKRKLFEAERKIKNREFLDWGLLQATFNSYFAHFNHANSYGLKEKFTLKLNQCYNN